MSTEAKKVVLFPEIDQVKFFYYKSARIFECVSEFTFFIKTKQKNKNKKKQKKLKKNREYFRKTD